MRTVRLKELMEDVLESLPKPYTEDLIEDVFVAIEGNAKWRKEYDDLLYNLGKPTVNSWGGFWIAHAAGRIPTEQVSAGRSSLLDAYSKLAKAPKSANKKVKEPQALEMMSEYFMANKATLSGEIRKHRTLIVELIKAGFAPADAFTKVLEKQSMAR